MTPSWEFLKGLIHLMVHQVDSMGVQGGSLEECHLVSAVASVWLAVITAHNQWPQAEVVHAKLQSAEAPATQTQMWMAYAKHSVQGLMLRVRAAVR